MGEIEINENNLYLNFDLENVSDLEKLKHIYEVALIMVEEAIEHEDIELGYESIFQIERRIRKFNNIK